MSITNETGLVMPRRKHIKVGENSFGLGLESKNYKILSFISHPHVVKPDDQLTAILIDN